MIYLETERLIIRDYTKNDAEEYSRLMADEQVMYYLHAYLNLDEKRMISVPSRAASVVGISGAASIPSIHSR